MFPFYNIFKHQKGTIGVQKLIETNVMNFYF